MTAAPRTITSVDEARELLGPDAARAARHAMWRRGDLRYLLHTGQERALERILASEARRFVICTGRRWGKSRLMCVVAVLVCVLRILWRMGVEPPEWVGERMRRVVMRTTRPARVVYAAPTAGMVAEFIEPHMLLLAQHAPPEMAPMHDSFAGRWVFPGGDTIVIRGCEDRRKADRLRGSEADACIADEGGFIPILGYVVRSILGPQLWETRGLMVLPSTPPESPDHPFVGLLTEAEAAGASFRARTADAPHISPAMLAEAIEDAGGADTIAWRREGEAEIIVDPEHTVLPEFSTLESLIVQPHPRPAHYLPHVIGDAGFVDLDVLAFGYYDFVHDLDVIEDEVVLSHARSDTLDAAVEAKERELWPGVKVHRRRIDAAPKVRADMSREEMQAEDGDGRFWHAISRDHAAAGANACRVRIKRGRVRVHPRCTTIIAHSRFARWNAQRSSFERPADKAHHYDGCAALIYFTRDLDRSANPFPKLPPGVHDGTHYIPDDLRADDAKAKVRAIFGQGKRRR